MKPRARDSGGLRKVVRIMDNRRVSGTATVRVSVRIRHKRYGFCRFETVARTASSKTPARQLLYKVFRILIAVDAISVSCL